MLDWNVEATSIALANRVFSLAFQTAMKNDKLLKHQRWPQANQTLCSTDKATKAEKHMELSTKHTNGNYVHYFINWPLKTNLVLSLQTHKIILLVHCLIETK